MKPAFILTAVASLLAAAVAAPAEENVTYHAVTEVDDAAQKQEVVTQAPGKFSLQAYCGGFTPAGCNSWCGSLGWQCWACGSNACFCANGVC
ncbi:hypothetical protein VTO42DRAFT_8405 [Malbranchea cinnamomea]